eukprot:m.38556 g.38556  ORF g.38556 m.38556 type:complete len:334 (+) comp9449_c0_seq1:438-1439(+)
MDKIKQYLPVSASEEDAVRFCQEHPNLIERINSRNASGRSALRERLHAHYGPGISTILLPMRNRRGKSRTKSSISLTDAPHLDSTFICDINYNLSGEDTNLNRGDSSSAILDTTQPAKLFVGLSSGVCTAILDAFKRFDPLLTSLDAIPTERHFWTKELASLAADAIVGFYTNANTTSQSLNAFRRGLNKIGATEEAQAAKRPNISREAYRKDERSGFRRDSSGPDSRSSGRDSRESGRESGTESRNSNSSGRESSASSKESSGSEDIKTATQDWSSPAQQPYGLLQTALNTTMEDVHSTKRKRDHQDIDDVHIWAEKVILPSPAKSEILYLS